MSLGVRFSLAAFSASTPISGVDESTGFIGDKIDPYSYVCRYLSWLPNPKVITPAEAEATAAKGWWIVANWEFAGTGLLSGTYEQQVAIGREANRQALLLRVPTSSECQAAGSRPRPIYFSVDESVSESDFPTIYNNLRGRQEGLGSDYEAGVYAEAALLDYLAGHGIYYLWQSNAWDTAPGYTSPHALIVQQFSQPTVNGVQCDLDEALIEDFGQWQPGKVPFPRTPVPPTHEGPVLHPTPTLPASSGCMGPQGYWLLTAAGQVYGFGGAFTPSNKPFLSPGESAVDIASISTSDTQGFWVLDSGGGVHNFGTFPWYGSPKADGIQIEARRLLVAPDGHGYAVLDSEGGLHQYGSFHWAGSIKTPV